MILPLDVEKTFDKIEHSLLMGNPSEHRDLGTFLDILKAITKSPQQISFSMGKHWEPFP